MAIDLEACAEFMIANAPDKRTATFVPNTGVPFDFDYVPDATEEYAGVPELPGQKSALITLVVSNSQITTLLSRDINKQLDKVRVATRYGGPSVLRSITDVVYSDPGFLKIICR